MYLKALDATGAPSSGADEIASRRDLEQRELPDGYGSAACPIAADTAEWVSLERRCCPSLPLKSSCRVNRIRHTLPDRHL